MTSSSHAWPLFLVCSSFALMGTRCPLVPPPVDPPDETCIADDDCGAGTCVTHPDVCLDPVGDIDACAGWCVTGACGEAETPAVDDASGACVVFPNTCIPPGWTPVAGCAEETCFVADDCGGGECRTHPAVCLQHGEVDACAGWCVTGACGEAETPAVDHASGACVVFPNTCIPPGWTPVGSCEHEECTSDDDCAAGEQCPIPSCCAETPDGLTCDDSCDQRRHCTVVG